MPGVPDNRSPIRVGKPAKANLDQLKRKHASRLKVNLTSSQTLEALTMVGDNHADEMDTALIVVLSAEAGRSHDGTGDG